MTTYKQTDAAVKKLATKFTGRAAYVSTGAGKNKTTPGTVFAHPAWKAQTWIAEVKTSGKVVGDPVPNCAIKARKATRNLWDRNTILALCKFAQSEGGRYALDNVEFEFSPDGVRATATDGRRLASIVDGKQDKQPIVFHVNAEALKFLVDLHHKLDKYDLSFALIKSARETRIGLAIYSGPALSILWQADGQWPDWKQVIPDTKYSVDMGTDFFDLIETVGRTTSIESHAVRLDFVDQKMIARAKYTSGVTVTAHGEIEAIREKGSPELSVGFDPRYVADAGALISALHKPMGGDALVFKYTDKDTGATVSQDRNSPYTILLMPIDV